MKFHSSIDFEKNSNSSIDNNFIVDSITLSDIRGKISGELFSYSSDNSIRENNVSSVDITYGDDQIEQLQKFSIDPTPNSDTESEDVDQIFSISIGYIIQQTFQENYDYDDANQIDFVKNNKNDSTLLFKDSLEIDTLSKPVEALAPYFPDEIPIVNETIAIKTKASP